MPSLSVGWRDTAQPPIRPLRRAESDDMTPDDITARPDRPITVACFIPGTAIATARGERLVEELHIGARIITRDNGVQTLRWIGRRTLSAAALARNPDICPILIPRGSLGTNLPERDLLVSPNHRLLVSNEQTVLHVNAPEVLAAAKHMTCTQGVRALPATQVTYIHLLFDRHEVILSNGCWSESFQPDDHSLLGFGNAQRAEFYDLFPHLKTPKGRAAYAPARPAVSAPDELFLAR